MYICIYVHTYHTYTYMQIYVDTYIHIGIHIYVHTYTHIQNTHTAALYLRSFQVHARTHPTLQMAARSDSDTKQGHPTLTYPSEQKNVQGQIFRTCPSCFQVGACNCVCVCVCVCMYVCNKDCVDVKKSVCWLEHYELYVSNCMYVTVCVWSGRTGFENRA
jgi:hypothetical protein